MNLPFLRPLVFSFIHILFLTGFAAAASAATVYTVQLGSFESEQEAREHWETLSKRFSGLFSPLRYASAKVQLPPDNFVYFRTQAGPLATREEADSICNTLAVKGFECYVAETAMFTADGQEIAEEASAPPAEEAPPPPPPPPAPVAATEPAPEAVDLTEAEEIKGMYARTAPAHTPPAVAQPKVAPSAANPLTSAPAAGGGPFEVGQSRYALSRGEEAPRVPTAAAVSVDRGETADLKVAEAVPVPLDGVNAAGGGYSSGPPVPERGLPSQQFRRPTLWAEVSYFASQDAALGYWRTLRSRDNAIPQGLRLRVVKPLRQRGGDNRLSLRVGPFGNTDAIRRLCSFTAPERLRCQAMRDIGSAVSYAQAERRRLDPAEAYARRLGATPFSRPPGVGTYWVQLGAYPTTGAAARQWSALQAAHGSLLGKVGEQIIAPGYSSVARSVYRLRAGPFTNGAEATNVCNALRQRGTVCMVVQAR